MDFSFTEAQLAVRERTLKFAREELGRSLVERDHRGAREESDWRGDWQRCADHGVFRYLIPQQYGGDGEGIMNTVVMLEALGHGCRDNGLTLGINGHIWATMEPLLRFGTQEQKLRYLPGLCNGSLLGTLAMTESGAGSDAFSLTTSARRCEGGYLLDGAKTYVGFAPACDIAIVFANTNPEHGQWGLTVFIVEASSEGVRRSESKQKMGLRTMPMGDSVFDGCFVPEENRLGPEGAGVSIFQNAMDSERSLIFASHVGSMARQLEDCVSFARQRVLFGTPITGFQSVSNRLADMKLRLETARLLLYKAAWSKSRGGSAGIDAALAKLHISEAFLANSLDAVRIHGGRGFLTEHGVERDLRDATGGVIYSGTSDIQRQIIARLLED